MYKQISVYHYVEGSESPETFAMEIWFKKLVGLGVLLVGELDSMLIYHPGFSHQGSTNHRGIDVQNFERCTYFQIVIPLAALCLGFHVPWVSLQNP